jgi:hypothetical protein
VERHALRSSLERMTLIRALDGVVLRGAAHLDRAPGGAYPGQGRWARALHNGPRPTSNGRAQCHAASEETLPCLLALSSICIVLVSLSL